MKAIYPGSFDPVTNGHIDVIKRAVKIFPHLTVAVAVNTSKQPLFNVEERVWMLTETTKEIKGIHVESFEGLIIDYASRKDIFVLIRGLRMFSDFEFELQMAMTNRRLNDHIETIFLMPSEEVSFISSTLLKQTASLGADISSFVPKVIKRQLEEKLKNENQGSGYTSRGFKYL